MDTELVTHIIELKAITAKVDERTRNIHKSQELLREALITHEERDRVDFDKLHNRVNKNDRKLNFLLGGVGLASFVIMAIISLIA